jgi:putative ABC transport system ATP-binding protein
VAVAAEAVLLLENIYRIYRAGPVETVALRGANLAVRRGEFVALVGPSGSGKSSLVQIAAGLDEPSAGQAWLEGRLLAGLDEEERVRLRRRRVGVFFQRDNLWPHLTALQNVSLAGSLARHPQAASRAIQLLQQLGLETRMHGRPSQLSGGEQQRVGLAMALAGEPALLLADEPTGELDAANEAVVLDSLESARSSAGCALLLVTHSDAVAGRAGRVVRIQDGVCDG